MVASVLKRISKSQHNTKMDLSTFQNFHMNNKGRISPARIKKRPSILPPKNKLRKISLESYNYISLINDNPQENLGLERLIQNPGFYFIIHNIFLNLDHKSLLSCRLVSRPIFEFLSEFLELKNNKKANF